MSTSTTTAAPGTTSAATILTIRSSNPTRDGNFLRDALISVSIDSSTGSILIEKDDYESGKDNDVSLWIPPLNALMVFIPEQTEEKSLSIRRSDVVAWTVPNEIFQKLRSSLQETHPDQVMDIDESCYRLQLPSKCSRIVVLPNSVSMQTTAARRKIRQLLHDRRQEQRMVDVSLATPGVVTTTIPSQIAAIDINRSDDNNLEQSVQLPNLVSLESKILSIDPQSSESNLSYQPFMLNAHTPIPFETDLFRGHILMILRPPTATDDPFWYERIFQSKKRRCIVNVQGQFKSIPQGIVYAGAEISQPMKLGLVIKGICTILLKLVERFNSNIHSSFGTATTDNNSNNNDQEAAHIVAPAYTFYERLVVTKSNELPPSILNEVEESSESIQLRKSCTSLTTQPKIWNTTDTYTFSFYSMYIDLPTWQLVGLPASGDIRLQTFWGSSLLRICMYDKTDGLTSQPKQHLLSKNRYAFSIQLEYLGMDGEKKQRAQTMESPKGSRQRQKSDDCSIDNDSGHDRNNKNDIFHTDRRLRHSLLLQQNQQYEQVMKHSESQLFLHESSSCDESIDENDDEDDLPFFDAKEDSMDLSNNHVPSVDHATQIPIENMLIHELSIVDQYCPYYIELCIPSRIGGSLQYVTAFACCVKSTSSSIITTSFRLEPDCENVLDGTIDNSSSMTIRESIDPMMNRFSSRISSMEKLRRYIGLALSDRCGDMASNSSKMILFRAENGTMNMYDIEFLSGTKVKPSTPNTVRLSSYVARAYSDRHWVEEWVCLYDDHITFRHLERRRSSELVLLLSNIITVEKLTQDLCPYNNTYPILALSTLASTVYLMFTSDSILENWRQMIDPVVVQQQKKTNNKILSSFGAAADDYLQKSSTWNCKNRRILNCGAYYFRIDAPLIGLLNPLAMAENVLRLATDLATNGGDSCNEKQLYDFVKSAAYLKHAFVSGCDEASRLAFYLNVYHAMISHAYLVLGPPDSSLKWINYFNNVAYQVGDDIFSLTELEHSIIRANMSYPTQFLSRFVIPKSAYPSLALTISDCRINFALNCGSLSNPSRVFIYQPQHLNQQLDDASRLYLLNSVSYRRTGYGDLELKLPRICQWFADDFGSTRPDLLSTIEPYLPPDVQSQLDGCRLTTQANQQRKQQRYDMSSITIRYHSYNFECRPLSIT